jgi:hypothetical protein
MYNIIIIGSGISGLYSAYNIKKISPETSFLILEKFHKKWIGGRTNNDSFYDAEIVTGAGIGRKDTNPLLLNLINENHIKFKEFHSVMDYSPFLQPIDIMKVINFLKREYKKYPQLHNLTFRQFFLHFFNKNIYNQFVITSGYNDYENADLYETLYNYGFDDTIGGWTGFKLSWKKLVHKLYNKIGKEHFKFNNNVIKIEKERKNNCLFKITTEKRNIYYCNKIILATTIKGIQNLIPGANDKNSLYQQIHGQPFLRLYGKFDKKSTNIMKKHVQNYTIVPGPLQKIIPIDSNKGIYMISYSDNANAFALKEHLENTPENRKILCDLIEFSLNIPLGTLQLLDIKSYYWSVGTHYYDPLNSSFQNRNEFLKKAQNPEKGIIIVGEAVSRYQGWVEGALESVETVLNKKWIINKC